MSPHFGGFRVLVVDDNPGDRRLVRALLTERTELGIQVREAHDVEAGLVVLAEEPCDVVLLDLNLGSSVGLESLRLFREAAPDIPILIHSGTTNEDVAVKSLRMGAADYVIKGEETSRSLRRTIGMVLERERLRGELSEQRAALVAQEERIYATAELVGDGLVNLDDEGIIVASNRAAGHLFGLRSEDMIGRPLSEFVDEIDQLIAGTGQGGAHHLQMQGHGGTGTELPLDVGIRPCSDAGEPGFIVAIHDLSAEFAAQEAIRRLEHQYELLLNSAGQGIVGLDSDGVITFVNPAAIEIFEVEADDLLGTCFTDHLGCSGDRPVPSIDELIENSAGQICVAGKGERCSPVATTARRLESEAPGEGAVVILEDLSEKRRLEDQFRQAQKMELMGQLAGGIAHDFNNELAVISLNAIMLRRELAAKDADILELLDAIYEATSRATRISRQLLNMSRRAELDLQTLDLAALLEDFGTLVTRLMPESISTELLQVDGEHLIRADSAALEQALLNLCTNSRDAMSDGGRLVIGLDRVAIEAGFLPGGPVAESLDPGVYEVITVTDNGCGMEPAILERILEPFYTTKPKERGTGLGLPMVYGLVKQMGGTLAVESAVGVGTTTRIFLPAEEQAPDQTWREATHGSWEGDGSGFTVLVVEDEEPLRKACRKILEHNGFGVVEACNGEEALRIFERELGGVDAVLSDNVMPEMSGSRLYRELVSRNGPVPFVIMTGYSQELPAELDDVPILQKPWRVETLLKTVWNELHRLTPSTQPES